MSSDAVWKVWVELASVSLTGGVGGRGNEIGARSEKWNAAELAADFGF